VAEAFHFATAAGVDPIPIREALLGGFAGSKILEIHGNRMLTDDYAPGFKTVLHKKDMGIVNDIVRELDLDAPISQLGLDALNRAMDAGYNELDSSALYKLGKKK
jgi:2-hydroxy-3-oxopropionate reductase